MRLARRFDYKHVLTFCLLPTLVGAAPITGDSALQEAVAFRLPPLPQPTVVVGHTQMRHHGLALRHHQRQHVLYIDGLAAANRNTSKKVSVIVPPKKVVAEVVHLRFVNPNGDPVKNAKVNFEVFDNTDKLIDKHSDTTADISNGATTIAGAITLKVKAFPSRLSVGTDEGEWHVKNPEQVAMALSGSEGDVVALNYPNLVAFNGSSSALRNLWVDQSAKAKQRVIVRNYSPEPIVLERDVVDINLTAEPSTKVKLAEDELGTTDSSGILKFQLPAWRVQDGEATFQLSRSVNNCEFRGSLPFTGPDPYKVNELKAPKLELVSIPVEVTGLTIGDNFTPKGEFLTRLYGKPKVEPSLLLGQSGGSEWWEYDKQGLSFKLRRIPVAKNGKGDIDWGYVTERIRITGQSGGSVAGVTAGSDFKTFAASVGWGSNVDDEMPLGEHGYVDNSVVVKETGNKIDWIELRRPVGYLKSGIDTTVATAKTRLFLEPITRSPGFGGMPDAENQIRQWLSDVPGLELVNDKDDANFALSVNLDQLHSEITKDKWMQSVPANCEATVQLTAKLDDASSSQSQDLGRQTGTAGASFEKEVGQGEILLAAVLIAYLVFNGKSVPTWLKALVLFAGVALGADAVQRMDDVMNRASQRCTRIALRNALLPAINALEAASDFRTPIVAVNRLDNTVTIGAGSKQGIQPGSEFEVWNGLSPLDVREKETGLRTERLIAKVTQVNGDNSICSLVFVSSTIDKKLYEKTDERPAEFALSKKESQPASFSILDPSTGIPEAHRIFRIDETSSTQ